MDISFRRLFKLFMLMKIVLCVAAVALLILDLTIYPNKVIETLLEVYLQAEWGITIDLDKIFSGS